MRNDALSGQNIPAWTLPPQSSKAAEAPTPSFAILLPEELGKDRPGLI
jgi:hypothetical protein